jgi:hypothetical protein
MFSSIKIMEQESFSDFVRAVTLFDFTETQNKLLIDVIKTNIEILCDKCTFELDALLVSLFEPNELIQYLEVLTEKRNLSVLQRVLDILLYEDFSNSDVSDDQIEILKQKIQKSITG